MSKINKIARKVAKNFSISLLSIAMLAAMSTPSHAINLFFCRIAFGRSGPTWFFVVDPENIQSFNLNMSFDPAEFAFQDIVYASPYTQLTPPDFSQLSSGLIQGIAGSSSTPVFGSGDLFTLTLTQLVTNPQSTVNVFPGSQSFMVTLDPDTGDTRTLGPDECPSCQVTVPEPITLFGSVMGLGFGAVLKKEHFRKQKKAKALEKLKA
jgi:hypothetical protein